MKLTNFTDPSSKIAKSQKQKNSAFFCDLTKYSRLSYIIFDRKLLKKSIKPNNIVNYD